MPKDPIMLEPIHLDAGRFASQDDSRGAITSVKIAPNGEITATNGHLLVRVPPSTLPAEDFPAVDGRAAAMPDAGALVPAQALKAALRTLPKRSHIPILKACHMGTNGNGKAILTTTDLETAHVSPALMPEGRFPECESCIPDERPDDVVVTLNAAYLRELADYADRHTGHAGALEIRVAKDHAEKHGPVRMSFEPASGGARVVMVLMPMHGREDK